MEDTKEFFRQCAKPFTHSWNSIRNTLRQLRDYWKEFKEWHSNPTEVSTRVLARHTPSAHGSGEVKVHSVSSSEDGSPLEHQYEHATPHRVPVSSFAALPAHMTLSPISSYQPKPKPRPMPHSLSQSSIIKSSHRTSPWSSETKIALSKTRSNIEDPRAGRRPLQPFPRSAYSSTELPSSRDSSDPNVARRHHTESTIPPQAAWAPTVLQPQERQVARKDLPRRKSEMSSRPPIPSHANSWFEKP